MTDPPDLPAPRAPGACAGDCPLPLGPDRRAFLRQAGLAAAAAVVGLGGGARAALAAPLAFTAPTAAGGDERTYPIPAADDAVIDTANEVILARWQGAVYAFNLACPHQHVALRRVDGPPAEARFQCPKHKSRYRPDGVFIEGRATRPMDRLGIRRAGDAVVVDTGALHKQPDDPAAWAAAVVRLA